MAFPFVLFHRDCFFNFYCLFRQRFLSTYLLKLFLLPQRVHATLFIRYDKPGLTRWCLCSFMLAYRCLHMKWWTAMTVVVIPSQKVPLMCPYVSSSKFSVLARSLHLIAVWSLQAIWLLEWFLQLPSFLAFYVSKGRAGRSNTSLRTLCFHFASIRSLPSTCYIQGDWYCLALP